MSSVKAVQNLFSCGARRVGCVTIRLGFPLCLVPSTAEGFKHGECRQKGENSTIDTAQ